MSTDIKEIIRAGESETVEFKESTGQLHRAMKTLCAFANHKGGTLIFGVHDRRKIIGQTVADSTIREVSNCIAQLISPQIYPSITKEEVGELALLVVTLPEGNNKPYVAEGRPYKRTGTTTQPMSQGEYERLLLERKKHLLRWDAELADQATVRDIDEGLIRSFVRTAQNARNLGVSDSLPIQELLTGLELMREQRLTNAAIALFGKRPQQFFVQLAVKAARFRGTTKDEFIDNRLFTGNLFDLYKNVQNFFSSHLRVAGKVSGDFSPRKDTPEYPLEALREAAINALIHRDYYNPGGSTKVAIYDDRIEIWNNGELPSGFTIETLYQPHRSVPQNPLVARAFFLYGAIETWGRGTLKILELCKQAGLPQPEFRQNSGGLEVRFSSGKVITESLARLNKTQQEIIAYLKKHGEAGTSELVKHLKISRTAVQNNLKKMSDAIQWSGKTPQDPQGRYRLK